MNYFQAFRAFCFTSWVSYLAVACFPTPAFGLFCGDSEPDLGEQCDDGNTTSGDGCSNTCLVEAGAVCTDAVAGVTEVNVVPNGNFELGKQDWTETSSDGSGPVFDPSSSGGNNFASDQDEGGEWWVWMGGRFSSYSGSVSQSITIPAGASTLQFDLWEASCVPEGGSGDFVSVEIDGNEVFNSGSCNSEGTYAQADTSIDLATATGGPYNDGGVHTIEIIGSMDFTAGDAQTGSIFVDRVRIMVPLVPAIPPIPSSCLLGMCGDGIESPGEVCDDGNTLAGDGCSAFCAVEETTHYCTPAEPAIDVLSASLSFGQDVQDPGMEAGFPNEVWTQTGMEFDPVCSQVVCGNNFAKDGAFFAWFGGSINPNTQTLSQDVLISPMATELRFDLRIGVCDSADDTLVLAIDGVPVFTEICTATQDYETEVIDLTTACGGSCADGARHSLQFTGNTVATYDGNSNFFVDNIRIEYPVSPDRPARPSVCQQLGEACTVADGGFGLEKFEAGIPPGWSKFELGNLSVSDWGTTNDGVCGSQNWPGGNVTRGTGEAACADSDAADSVGSPDPAADQTGPNAMDSYLCTPQLDLGAMYEPELVFNSNYQNANNGNIPGALNSDETEFLEVLSGTVAPNALSLTNNYATEQFVLDHLDATLELSPPGLVSVDLSAYSGQSSVWVCLRYGGNFSWFAQVDNVALRSFNCASSAIPDADLDGVPDPDDNCPGDANAEQEDFDGDGVGYVCDTSCNSGMDFNANFVNGDVYTIESSGRIHYQGVVESGAIVTLNGGGGVAIKNNSRIESGAQFGVDTDGCLP